MAKKPIIWSERALQELEGILDFYNSRNQSTTFSDRILALTEDVLSTISESEGLGRKSKLDNIRIFPLKYFLIINKITPHHIEVLSFWDNRQYPIKRNL